MGAGNVDRILLAFHIPAQKVVQWRLGCAGAILSEHRRQMSHCPCNVYLEVGIRPDMDLICQRITKNDEVVALLAIVDRNAKLQRWYCEVDWKVVLNLESHVRRHSFPSIGISHVPPKGPEQLSEVPLLEPSLKQTSVHWTQRRHGMARAHTPDTPLVTFWFTVSGGNPDNAPLSRPHSPYESDDEEAQARTPEEKAARKRKREARI